MNKGEMIGVIGFVVLLAVCFLPHAEEKRPGMGFPIIVIAIVVALAGVWLAANGGL